MEKRLRVSNYSVVIKSNLKANSQKRKMSNMPPKDLFAGFTTSIKPIPTGAGGHHGARHRRSLENPPKTTNLPNML
jgi:hypothetical protein